MLRERTLALLTVACALVPATRPAAAADDAASADGERPASVLLDGPPRPVERPAAAAADGGTADFATVNVEPEGDMPRDIAFTTDGSAAVVVHRDTDAIAFFDVATQTVTDSVGVGDFPVSLAVTDDHVVVANVFDDSVSVVDVDTRALVATVPVTGSQPYAVAVSDDGTRAVVGVINDGVASSFSVIDLVSFAETHTFASAPQGVIGFFFGLENGIFGNLYTKFALSGDGTRLVQPDRGGDQVVIHDVDTGAVLAGLPVAAGPTSVDLSDDDLVAVVGHEGGGSDVISEIDVAGLVVTGSFAVANPLQGQIVRITPSKSHAIAAISNNVIFVDLATGATTATLATGVVGDIEISFDGQYAFVSNFSSRVVDVASQTIVASLPLAPTAEAAASPVEHRVVGVNNRFAEDLHLYSTDGAASVVEGVTISGEAPEADAPRTIGIPADGLRALVANNTSRTATVLDVATGGVVATLPTGERCLGVAVTADGAHGVVCNGDEDTVTIVDLAAAAVVADLPVATRPAEVAVSPDGTRAYVTTVAGLDRLHYLSLAGAASTVTGSLVSGQMGSALGYTYTALSGLAASPAGDVVAVCVSFDDELLIADGASPTELARVPTGDFPIRVAFLPDGSRAYVANAFGDSVTVVDVDGAASTAIATVPGIEFPLVMEAGPSGDFVYVGNTDGGAPRLFVVDTTTHAVVADVALPSSARASHLSALDGRLFLACVDGELATVSVAGAASTLLDTTELAGSPSDLAFSETLQTAVCCEPGALDGVDLADGNLPLWSQGGGALAGLLGEPVLVGAGTLVAGTTATFTLANARPSSTFAMIVGLGEGNVPFKGGTLVPTPNLIVAGFPTSASGSAILATVWPAGVPLATTLVFQAWVTDPAGPAGFAASQSVTALTP